MNVVDSPPGTISPSSPSSSSGLRISTASTPSRRSICTCSRKFPCTAKTPIFTGSIVSGRIRFLEALGLARGDAALLQAEGDEQESDEREHRVRHPVSDVRDSCYRHGLARPLLREVIAGEEEA